MQNFSQTQLDRLADIVRKTRPLFENTELLSSVHQKGQADFVTDVDYQVQSFLLSELAAFRPDIQFMGEEKDNSNIDFSGLVWILDPVDGTTNLIHRFRQSSVSLALAENQTIIAGIIYNPYTDELFSALKGCGSSLNGQPVTVSSCASLSDSLVSVGTSPYIHDYADWNFRRAKEIFLRCQDIRRLGSAALDLAYVACGRTDGFYEIYLSPWDYAAGLLLIEEAGGRVTDFSGNPPDCSAPSSILATNGSVHEELRELLEQHP